MSTPKLGTVFKRALLVEDSEDICDLYKDFFESENLAFDILKEIPKTDLNVKAQYDLLLSDWMIGVNSVKSWLASLAAHDQLPIVTIIATGMLGVDQQLDPLPIKIIYKPFDFTDLRELMLGFKESPGHQI